MPERLRQILLDLLRSTPTDAVPVVRCRDCKFASHRAASVYPVVECMRPDVGDMGRCGDSTTFAVMEKRRTNNAN